MARYATLQDYINQFPDLDVIETSYPDEPGEEFPNSQKVERQLELACDLIDGKLALIYSVPLQNPPNIIKRIALYFTREQLDQYGDREQVVRQFDFHWKLLEKIAGGDFPLIDGQGNPIASKDIPENRNQAHGVSYGSRSDSGMGCGSTCGDGCDRTGSTLTNIANQSTQRFSY